MKFKAVWKTDACEVVAPAILSVLRDNSNEKCSIKLTPSRFYFTSACSRRDQAESWVALDANTAFSSVLCESLRGNHIDLAVSSKALALVLKYVGMSAFCAMRLTKRNSTEPIVRFEFNFIDTGNCLVVHDLPVEVLRSELAWSEPVLPDPDSRCIISQPVKKLSNLIDRLKQMGLNEITVDIDQSGSFANVNLGGVRDAIQARVTLHRQPLMQLDDANENRPDIVHVTLTLSGLSFVLGRALAIGHMSRCVMMACEDKYLSVWLQLPNRYGSIAAVTPAIIPD